jgi:hypothetical protein
VLRALAQSMDRELSPRGIHAAHSAIDVATFCGPDVPTADFQLRFRPLFTDREAFVVPCSASGQVVMDALSERVRNSYLFHSTLPA